MSRAKTKQEEQDHFGILRTALGRMNFGASFAGDDEW